MEGKGEETVMGVERWEEKGVCMYIVGEAYVMYVSLLATHP